jgi:cytochrome P450
LRTDTALQTGFPIGATVDVASLERDPYPVYRRLREAEPVSWIAALDMWWVTGYAEVRRILLDTDTFTTAWPGSLIHDTFGAQMLTTEGAAHDRYRASAQSTFMPANVRGSLEPAIAEAVASLVAGLPDGPVELRTAFASRLPIQTILIAFGLPLSAEPMLRGWYDAFEGALANFHGDEAVRRAGQASVEAFHGWIDGEIAAIRAGASNDRLLGVLVRGEGRHHLDDAEIRRNMLIIFFGAISTVEALILNAVWALGHHAHALERVRADRALLMPAIEETIRWLGPVQSATRHVVSDTTVLGVPVRTGDVVNCMLGGANHDPAVFPDPEKFDIDRPNAAHHLGFATGPHLCLGLRLAKAEARVALDALLDRFPRFAIDHAASAPPSGFEFRQSKRLVVTG